MRLRPIFCAASMAILSGCGDPRPVVVSPQVPPELLQPVAAPCPPFETEGDVGRCVIRLAAGLHQANGQITAIADIVGPQ
jgi:hypothetical protein